MKKCTLLLGVIVIEKNLRFIALGLVIIILVILLSGIFRQRGRVDDIGKQLNQAGANQQSITEQIGESQAGAGAIQESINKAEQSANVLAGEQQEAGEIIAECQSIIARIRARGERD